LKWRVIRPGPTSVGLPDIGVDSSLLLVPPSSVLPGQFLYTEEEFETSGAMSMVGELKAIIGGMKSSHPVDLCAIISRNGIPLASDLPPGADVEVFSTLCATILGASDVISSGLGKNRPEMVAIRAGAETLVISGLGQRALIVAGSSRAEIPEISKAVAEASSKVEEVLRREAQ